MAVSSEGVYLLGSTMKYKGTPVSTIAMKINMMIPPFRLKKMDFHMISIFFFIIIYFGFDFRQIGRLCTYEVAVSVLAASVLAVSELAASGLASLD